MITTTAVGSFFAGHTPSGLRFGWSKTQPPKPKDYHFEWQQADFKQGGNLEPTDKALQQVADQLVGKDNPRFVLITGLKDRLGLTGQQIHDFQARLMEKLANLMKQQYPETLGNKDAYTVSREQNNGLRTDRSPHWDRSAFFSIAYGPIQGLTGGKPVVFDFNEWRQDKKDWLTEQMKSWAPQDRFDVGKNPISFDEAMALLSLGGAQASKDLREHYSVTLDEADMKDDMPILILNDSESKGVAHGGSPIQFDSFWSKAFWGKRPLQRVYIRPQ